jgi:hypothetical protein
MLVYRNFAIFTNSKYLFMENNDILMGNEYKLMMDNSLVYGKSGTDCGKFCRMAGQAGEARAEAEPDSGLDLAGRGRTGQVHSEIQI